VRWPAWLVRTVIFGGLGLLLIIAVGGRVRADRALARADEISRLGTPGEVAARAQQMVSVWAGEPSPPPVAVMVRIPWAVPLKWKLAELSPAPMVTWVMVGEVQVLFE
jgi:hypothetical protein